MTEIPAGWYPDPAPVPPGRPSGLRYWDGTGWTEHVHAPQPPTYPTYPSYPPGYAPVAAQPATTPDGQRLSGWWMRVLAVILDAVITTPLMVLAAVPVLVWQSDELSAWFSDLGDTIEHGGSTPPEPALLDPTTAPGLLLALSFVVAAALYSIVFLRWTQATPGKLVLGLRVRRRATPGPLPWGTILARVGFVSGLSALAQVPWVGFLFLLAGLLDVLWPLWDPHNQALHDKVARTNVVRTDSARTPGAVTGQVAAAPQPVADVTDEGIPIPKRW